MSYFATAARTVKARKKHNCAAFDHFFWYGGGDKKELTPEEVEVVERMEAKNGKIQVGEEYLFWSGFNDGDPFCVRANKEMCDIVDKYDLWDWL